LKGRFKNQNGEVETMQMGCFGLGMTRILAGVVEASHDTDVRMHTSLAQRVAKEWALKDPGLVRTKPF